MPGFNVHINNSGVSIDRRLKSSAPSIKGASYELNWFSLGKYPKDNFFYENEEFIAVLDGVVLNKCEIQKNDCSWPEMIVKLYQEKGDTFFNAFRGSFSGLLFDKGQNRWIFFADHIGSKPLYYYHYKGALVLSSEISDIYHYLKRNRIAIELEEQSVAMLLTYGYMLENKTLAKAIYKVCAGTYLVLQDDNLVEHSYYRLPLPLERGQIDLREQIEEVDRRFRNAIRLQFEKDKEYGHRHFVALSGGLDSRMTSIVAHNMGYINQLNFTFSQSNYLDEILAKKVASDFRHDWIFKFLDNGLFLRDIEEITKVTGGNVLYYGIAHGNSLLKLLNFNDLGIIHSGQLGDVILGSYIKSLESNDLSSFKRRYSDRLQVDLGINFDSVAELERAMLYNRGFNGINNSSLVLQQYTETLSPFNDIDFMEHCLSIPLEHRMNHKLYIKWILEKYPIASNYIWERTGQKITKHRTVNFFGSTLPISKIRYLLLYKFKLIKSKTNSKNHMNPLDYWYDTNEDLRDYLNEYFRANIDRLSSYQSLKNACTDIYKSGNAIEKNQVLSLLAALKLFF